MKRKIYTLYIIEKNNQILLGLKKRGFGMGKWNGFGGKVMESESITQGAIRELKEECNINPIDGKFIALLIFHLNNIEM